MRSIVGFGPLIAVGIVGILLVIFAYPISKWIAKNRTDSIGIEVGRVVRTEGGVRRLHGSDVEVIPAPLPDPIAIRHGDRIQTSVQSKATLILNSGDEFVVNEGSAIEFQLWNPRDASSAIYVKELIGTLTLTRPGMKGKAYVVREGRLYTPGQIPLKKAMALTVLRNAPLDMRLAETPTSGAEFEPDTSTEAAPPPGAADPETLSNEYIDETVVGQQAQFQKCWLTRIKDAPSTKGQIVVQFEITKRGKVKEARVADSTIEDEMLKKCVVSVFERTVFRPYKGAEISLSYPVNFE